MQNKRINIPNILTITRFVIVFVIFALYQLKITAWVEISFALFLFGAISDYFDGFFARKYKMQSDFGRCFDPISDKIFVFGMLLILNKFGTCNFFIMFLIIAREITVSGIREYLGEKNVMMPVSVLAKYKTGFQMASIGILLFREGIFFRELFYMFYPLEIFFDNLILLGKISLYTATLLTLYTGFLYLKTLIKHLK